MRLGGRLSAAIEILADIEARRRPVAVPTAFASSRAHIRQALRKIK